MTERAEYQTLIEQTDIPDIIEVDFGTLNPDKISDLKARRFGIYAKMYAGLSIEEKVKTSKERERRREYSNKVEGKLSSTQLIYDLSGIHREISFLYRSNLLTKSEEKKYIRKLAPTLFEYGIDLP